MHPFVCTLWLHNLLQEIWFLRSCLPNLDYLTTFLINLVLNIFEAAEHRGRRDCSENSCGVEASFHVCGFPVLPRNPKSCPHLLEILFDAEEADTWRGSKSGACVGQWQRVLKKKEKETSATDLVRQNNPCSNFTVTVCLLFAKRCYRVFVLIRPVQPLPCHAARERDLKRFLFVKVLKGLNCKFILAILTYKYKTIK